MWVHTNSDIKKVAACKTKPYELIDRESQEYKQQVDQDTKQGKKKRKVMLEDGLRDVEDLLDPEEEERKDALKINDAKSNVVGTNYLKIVNHMSFSDYAIWIQIETNCLLPSLSTDDRVNTDLLPIHAERNRYLTNSV